MKTKNKVATNGLTTTAMTGSLANWRTTSLSLYGIVTLTYKPQVRRTTKRAVATSGLAIGEKRQAIQSIQSDTEYSVLTKRFYR